MRRWIRDRLSYANVMATLAVFIALGGTSYALTLPRNSVGAAQLRSNAVGNAELRPGAVTSRSIANRAVRLRDLSAGTLSALRGAPGPAGPPGRDGAPGAAAPTLTAAVDTAGGIVRGTATSTMPWGLNGRVIGFKDSVAGCFAAATLLPTSPAKHPPASGQVTVAPYLGEILVRTYRPDGYPTFLPFNLIVAC